MNSIVVTIKPKLNKVSVTETKHISNFRKTHSLSKSILSPKKNPYL